MNLKKMMAIVLKTLGKAAFGTGASGNMELSAEDKTKLESVFGKDFVEKFADALGKEKSGAEPQAEGDTAEVLMEALRGHHATQLANGLQELQQQLREVNSANKTLQETVAALSAAPESEPAAENPAAALALKPGVAKVMSVDYNLSHYAAAVSFLQTGYVSNPSAATIEVGDLKTEFGKFLSQGQNNLQIIKKIYTGFTSAKYFTPVMAITEYRAIRALITSVVQQFSAKWTPSGKAKFTPITIVNRRHKINYPIVPAEVLDSYMLKLYDESLAPEQMPITKYIWEELIYPQIMQDIELRMIAKGKYIERVIAENSPGAAPEDGMDGLETIIAESKEVEGQNGMNFFEKYPDFNFRTCTDQEMLDFVQDFVDWISPQYSAGAEMPIFCSKEFRTRYRRAYKNIWGTGSGQSGDFGSDKIDFSNNMLVVLDGMYASPIIFSTPKNNMLSLRYKNALPNVITDVQKVNYEVRLFGEFWLAVGFAIGEGVFAFCPDGYDPTAQIDARWGNHDTYQKWIAPDFEDASGSGSGSDDSGL